MSDHFFDELPEIRRFRDLFSPDGYREVPRDRYLALTDVVSSTKAISEGRYKEVNISGAIAAMAIANLQRGLRFPFVFGGDGMACLVPGDLAEATRDVLADTRAVVRTTMDLDLRVALVPVADLADAGEPLRMGRYFVNESYAQAVFMGNGLALAEEWVKREGRYLIPDDHVVRTPARYDGFSCRWEDIPSAHGETIALIVQERSDGALRHAADDVERICGVEESYRPITVEAQQIVNEREAVEREVRVHARSARPGLFRRLRVWVEIISVRVIIALNLPLRRKGKELRRVKQHNVAASDFRKLDGGLKMVLSVTPEQRTMLRHALEGRRRAGELYFGMHVSDRALMTCLIDVMGNGEVHFIDAADGGYALAAREMKEQIAGR